MSNSKVDIDWRYFEAPLDPKESPANKDSLKENPVFNDLGSMGTYYFTTSHTPLPTIDLVSNLPEKLVGRYLFLGIRSICPPYFYMVVSLPWLQSQLQVEEVRIVPAIRKVLTEWQKEGTPMAIKYAFFQKNYTQSPHQSIVPQAYFFELLYFLFKSIDLEIHDGIPEKYIETEIETIIEVEAQITQNLSLTSPTIEQMATMAGMSITKFKVLFKKVFGQSPHQYILEKKFDYAKTLLHSGKYTHTQIAYMLGYNHTSGFTRIYKKKFHE